MGGDAARASTVKKGKRSAFIDDAYRAAFNTPEDKILQLNKKKTHYVTGGQTSAEAAAENSDDDMYDRDNLEQEVAQNINPKKKRAEDAFGSGKKPASAKKRGSAGMGAFPLM
jgi:hypothetical protein